MSTEHRAFALLTLDEMAHALRISKTTAYRLVWRHQIPSIRVSGLLRFHEADIREYLERKRAVSVDPETL